MKGLALFVGILFLANGLLTPHMPSDAAFIIIGAFLAAWGVRP